MFEFLKRKPEKTAAPKAEPDKGNDLQPAGINAGTNRSIDFTRPITDEESALVSVISSAVLAGDQSDTTFRVKSISGIDVDKEAAAVAVGAILAGDQSDSVFYLKSIVEIYN